MIKRYLVPVTVVATVRPIPSTHATLYDADNREHDAEENIKKETPQKQPAK